MITQATKPNNTEGGMAQWASRSVAALSPNFGRSRISHSATG